jgi:hypothetical protein
VRTRIGRRKRRMSDPLPQLLDAKALQRELGVTRAAAEKLMRHLPVVTIDDLRKVYVRRDDVLRYLDEHTYAKDHAPTVRPSWGGETPVTPPRPTRRSVGAATDTK